MKSGAIHPEFPQTVKAYHLDFGGEILLGHLRYATSGVYKRENCHPYVRQSNWPTRNLMLAGNFTITNEKDLNEELINHGQHLIFGTDTQAILEQVGFHLDEAHDAIYHRMRDQNVDGRRIPKIISQELDPIRILRNAAAGWDGGYTVAGLIGNGDSFVMRDPQGIRPLLLLSERRSRGVCLRAGGTYDDLQPADRECLRARARHGDGDQERWHDL